jgi:hypothetical protein
VRRRDALMVDLAAIAIGGGCLLLMFVLLWVLEKI